MTCIYLTIFEEVDHCGLEEGAIDTASLYREFEKVKDGRGAKGKHYPLLLSSTQENTSRPITHDGPVVRLLSNAYLKDG